VSAAAGGLGGWQAVGLLEATTRVDLGQWKSLLSGRGMRLTKQRWLVLAALSTAGRPLSHSELATLLGTSRLDRATIYRNLVSLADAGLIVRARLGDQIWRYQLPEQDSVDHCRHPHFACLQCGVVSCLPKRCLRLTGDARLHEVTEVLVRGRCAKCVMAIVEPTSASTTASGGQARSAQGLRVTR
jgi:Fur family transcriptional regulator, ferric uptake regulator